MIKKVVALLFGGNSSEHEISKRSAQNIISNLSREKYTVLPIYITNSGSWLLYENTVDNISTIDFDLFGTTVVLSPDANHKGLLRIVGEKVKLIPIDIVFPVLHGKNGEDGTIQGLCELAEIPYVGCGVLASSVSMDKAYTNLIAEYHKINQAPFFVTSKADIENNIETVVKSIKEKTGYPCFVKPCNAGSSIGVSKAKNKKELISALNLAIKHDRKILIEKEIIGRELECAVLGNYDCETSNVGEIVANATFYDFDAKYNSTSSKTVVPANIPEEISNEIKSLSKIIFKAVDGTGLARVDFFLEEKTNKVMFNEINTMPGFTSISLFPTLFLEKGLKTNDLVDKLIDLAFDRFNQHSISQNN